MSKRQIKTSIKPFCNTVLMLISIEDSNEIINSLTCCKRIFHILNALIFIIEFNNQIISDNSLNMLLIVLENLAYQPPFDMENTIIENLGYVCNILENAIPNNNILYIAVTETINTSINVEIEKLLHNDNNDNYANNA